MTMSRRAALAGLASASIGIRAAAQDVSRMTVLTNRFSATEYFTDIMRNASRGPLEVRMVSVSQLREQTNISLGGGGVAAFDVIHVNAISRVAELAQRGWLLPLDELIAKNRNVLDPDDIEPVLWRAVRSSGETFAVPFALNAQVFFYRRDVFTAGGWSPPDNLDGWLELAGRFHTRIPLILTMRGGGLVNEFNNALVAHGGTWLDARGGLAFNSRAGVHALETLRRFAAVGPRAMANFTNDDAMVALQQGLAATSNMWISRGSEMDDPSLSRVGGRIAFARSPVGDGQRPYSGLGIDCWAVPRTVRDPEAAFQLILAATSRRAMQGGAKFCLSPRRSVASDETLNSDFPWNSAAALNIAGGTEPEPAVGYFPMVREAAQPVLHRALRAQTPAGDVLDEMERDALRLLRERDVRI